MAAYRRVYDSRHLLADCQEPGSAPEPVRSVVEYGLSLLFREEHADPLKRLLLPLMQQLLLASTELDNA